MAVLTVENASITGLNPATKNVAAGGGDSFANNERTFVVIENASGGAITVTFDDTASTAPSGAKTFDADVDVLIAAGDTAVVGPFSVARFTNSVAMTYSGVTSLTVAVINAG